MSASARHFEEKPKRSSWQRRLGRLVGIAVLVLGGILLMLQTPMAKRLLVFVLNRQLGSSHYQLQFEGLTGILPHHPRFQSITVADPQGPWLNISNVDVEWHPSQWLQGRIVIDSLIIKRLHIQRHPVQPERPVESSQEALLPQLPELTIGRLECPDVTFPLPSEREPCQLGLIGNVRLGGGSTALHTTLQVSGDANTDLQLEITTPENNLNHGAFDLRLTTEKEQASAQATYLYETDRLVLTDVNIVVPGAQLSGNTSYHRDRNIAEGDLLLEITDPSPVATRLGVSVQGRGQARIRLQAQKEKQHLQGSWETSDLIWSDLRSKATRGHLELKDLWHAPAGTLSLDASALTWQDKRLETLELLFTGSPASGQVSVKALDLLHPSNSFTTEFQWQKQDRDWALSVQPGSLHWAKRRVVLSDPASLILQAGESHTLRCLFDQWHLDVDDRDFVLSGDLTIDTSIPSANGTLHFGGELATDLALETHLNLKQQRADYRFTVTRNHIPIQGDAQITWTDNAFAFPKLEITGPGIQATGRGTFHRIPGQVEGTAKCTLKEATPITTFLGKPASGHGEIRIDLRRHQEIQLLAGSWDLSDVNVVGLQVRSLSGDIEVDNVLHSPAGRVTCQTQGVTWQEHQIDNLHVTGSGTKETLRIGVLGQGHINHPIALDLNALLQVNHEEQPLVLEQALFFFDGQTWVLNHPAILFRQWEEPNRPSRFHFQDWQWAMADAVVSIDGWFDRNQLDLQAALSETGINTLPWLETTDLTGALQAQAQISGTWQQPCVELSSTAHKLGLRGDDANEVPHFQSTLQAHLTPNYLDAHLSLTTDADDRIQCQAISPVTFSLWPWRFQRQKTDWQLGLIADADVRLLDWLPVFRETDMEGRLVTDLTYRHREDRGLVRGAAQWKSGRYEDILLGTVVQDIQAHLRAQGQELILDAVSATAGTQGQLSAQGRLCLSLEKDLPYHFRIQAKEFPWIQRPDVTTSASGFVTLTGTTHTLALDGQLSIDTGEFNLEALPPAPPPTLMAGTATPVSEASVDSSSAPTRLAIQGDLKLDLHKGFHIYGLGLDSIWDGHLSMARSEEHWEVTGQIAPKRGEFKLLGRPFRLTEGFIRLDGSWPIAPILNLVAVHRRRGIEARVRISGRASDPVVRLESDPPLPEDAILATVLFGRDLATISPMQAVQLASAIKKLHSPGGGVDVFQWTRQTIGVDTIEIRPGEDASQSSSMAVGKYFKPEVYVELQQPLSRGGVTSTHIEYEIRPNLTLETDAGPGIRPGFGVNWKRDY